MKVKILSKNEWQSYPIIDGMIEVSEENLQAIRDGIKEFDSYGNIIEKAPLIEESIQNVTIPEIKPVESPVKETVEPTAHYF